MYIGCLEHDFNREGFDGNPIIHDVLILIQVAKLVFKIWDIHRFKDALKRFLHLI